MLRGLSSMSATSAHFFFVIMKMGMEYSNIAIVLGGIETRLRQSGPHCGEESAVWSSPDLVDT